MENKERNIDFDALIIRHFANEISTEDQHLLALWRAQSAENEKYFREQEMIWDEVEKAIDIVDIDVDKEWNNLSEKLDRKIELIPRKRSLGLSKIAAAILLLMIAAIGLYFIVSSGENERLFATLEPEKFSLPDGSEITLNINASILYTEKYNKKERSLKLEKGEAFFDVVSNKEKPFIVEVEDLCVKVVGTSFNISSEEESRITVIVESGRVEVYGVGNEDNKIVLNPGEKGVFDTHIKQINKSLNEDENFNSWRTKRLVFRDKELSKVVKKLNSTYHTNIIITTDAISDCRFTSTIENQSLEYVLTLLQSALNLEIKQTTNSIELSGEGC